MARRTTFCSANDSAFAPWYVKGILDPKERIALMDANGKPLDSTTFRPGEVIKDSSGKEIMRQTKPGEVLYDKPTTDTPFENGEQLRVRNTPNSRQKRVFDNKGKKVDAPNLINEEIAALYQNISGNKRSHPFYIQLGTHYSNNIGDTMASVATQQDLEKVLTEMSQNKRFPVIVAVYANQRPFSPELTNLLAGGSGGYHVVNIQGYDPVTKKVTFTNQWGSRNDHVANGGVSIDLMWKGMNKPKENLILRAARKIGLMEDDD